VVHALASLLAGVEPTFKDLQNITPSEANAPQIQGKIDSAVTALTGAKSDIDAIQNHDVEVINKYLPLQFDFPVPLTLATAPEDLGLELAEVEIAFAAGLLPFLNVQGVDLGAVVSGLKAFAADLAAFVPSLLASDAAFTTVAAKLASEINIGVPVDASVAQQTLGAWDLPCPCFPGGVAPSL